MTSKKNSTNSLKQWVTKIRRYEYELPRLYEKLEYLEVRSIGYNSPSFEPRLGSSGSGYKGIDYWLVKIDACERQIKRYEDEVSKYKNFVETLDEIEQTILLQYFHLNYSTKKIIETNNLKRYKIYELITKITAKYSSRE